MKTAYFDCFSGAGGDMIVASLIDAGADAAALTESLTSLGLADYALSIAGVNKQGFAATRFSVTLKPSDATPHRHLSNIASIISGSPLPDSVKQRSIGVFERLARAEAGVHGTTMEQVHFHEVGAVDAILDIVGAVVALDLLKIDRVLCSPLAVGSGTIECEHGTLPVPAPATAELLTGVPIQPTAQTGELLTPTAAALLTHLAESFGPMPPMTVQSVGYGAGKRDGNVMPNVLRVFVGDLADSACRSEGAPRGAIEQDSVMVLETNIDDSTPEIVGFCLERLLEEGALDAFAVPIQMKKSRSGVLLTVLCREGDIAALEGIVFSETSTLGIRRHRAQRSKLARRYETVATPFGEIRVKVAEWEGKIKSSPEYEECKRAARTHGVPLQDVVAAAADAWGRSHAASTSVSDPNAG